MGSNSYVSAVVILRLGFVILRMGVVVLRLQVSILSFGDCNLTCQWL